MRSRAGAASLVLALCAACGQVTRTGGVEPTPAGTRSVGELLHDALPTDDLPTPPAGGVTPGTGAASFAITLTDDNELHPAGIPVKLSGPTTRTVLSDAAGVVKGSVPPGDYRVEVVKGCHAAVLVRGGGSARVGMAAGDTTRGNLGVLWQHRFGPSSPVIVDRSGDWPVGEPVDVEFTLSDRCSEDPAPGKSFPTFVLKPSANLRVTKAPPKAAGPGGTAHVVVTCTAKGSITLDMVDQANPEDRLDLIAAAIGYGGVPRCV